MSMNAERFCAFSHGNRSRSRGQPGMNPIKCNFLSSAAHNQRFLRCADGHSAVCLHLFSPAKFLSFFPSFFSAQARSRSTDGSERSRTRPPGSCPVEPLIRSLPRLRVRCQRSAFSRCILLALIRLNFLPSARPVCLNLTPGPRSLALVQLFRW